MLTVVVVVVVVMAAGWGSPLGVTLSIIDEEKPHSTPDSLSGWRQLNRWLTALDRFVRSGSFASVPFLVSITPKLSWTSYLAGFLTYLVSPGTPSHHFLVWSFFCCRSLLLMKGVCLRELMYVCVCVLYAVQLRRSSSGATSPSTEAALPQPWSEPKHVRPLALYCSGRSCRTAGR